jgi:hypothetical protein
MRSRVGTGITALRLSTTWFDNIPELTVADAPTALHPEPQRDKDTGNNKEEIKTDSNNPFPKPLSTAQVESKQACQDRFTDIGERALADGMHPVYVGSQPYQARLALRGADGMPRFVDRATIGGKQREIVWMPSVFPLKGSAEF